jgi:adenylosuccinate lyase
MDNLTYKSPFSWRYGSDEMRKIWSLQNTRALWRSIWVSLAEVQVDYGLVSLNQISSLKNKVDEIDLSLSLELESQLQHDLMAELKVFADQCPDAGGILHLGATSMDIKDNAGVLQQKSALNLILQRSEEVLIVLSRLILEWADTPVIGFTHLQPAEPTTLGYRLAQPAQDLLNYHMELVRFRDGIKAKGFTGAVGTSASFAVLLGEENLPEFQEKISRKLDLAFYPVVNQTYPRVQDYQLLSLLAGQGAVLYKLAFDLRLLQSPVLGELAEPFGNNQVGSSAMPFKQNPIKAEKLNSLGRILAQLPRTAWDNAAHSLLERTLDDSANRRIILPEAFLCADEMLATMTEVLSGLQVYEDAIQNNLAEYGPFAATEKVLMLLSKQGADRQEMHHRLRDHSLQAWAAIRKGDPNPLPGLIADDPVFLEYLSADEIHQAVKGSGYLGDAAKRAKMFSEQIKVKLSS